MEANVYGRSRSGGGVLHGMCLCVCLKKMVCTGAREKGPSFRVFFLI